MKISHLSGTEINRYFNELATLRIKVFSEFPYLYEGSYEYEKEYLKTYEKSQNSLVILLQNSKGEAVGASTGILASDGHGEIQTPLQALHRPLSKIFYFGESTLLKEYRGRGHGKYFMTEREKFARQLGAELLAFCAVERLNDHPLRPSDYRSLESFWSKNGFTKKNNLVAHFDWKDINQQNETTKNLVFWLKEI